MVYVFDYLDLVPYILLWLVLFICQGINNSCSFIVATTSLIFFSAIRYGVGYDYPAYVGLINGDHIHVEWFSKLLMDLAYNLKFTQLYFILNSILCVLPVSIACKKYSNNPSLSLFFFALIPLFFIDSMSIVRNASAYSMIFLGGVYLIEKKWIRASILAILATGLHSSAYIFIVLYGVIILRNVFTYKINVIIYFISMIVMFFNLSSVVIENLSFFSFLSDSVLYKLEAYSQGLTDQGRFVKYVWFIIGALNLLFIKTIRQSNVNVFLFFTLYNVGLFLWSFFNFDQTLSLRLSTFFFLYLILFLPYLNILKKKFIIHMKIITISFFTLFCGLSFYVNIQGYNTSDKSYNKISFLPYQTIFNHTKYSNYN